jgi:hypothetical protein
VDADVLSRSCVDSHNRDVQVLAQALGQTENAGAVRASDAAHDRTARHVVGEKPFACARRDHDDWAATCAGHLQRDAAQSSGGEPRPATRANDQEFRPLLLAYPVERVGDVSDEDPRVCSERSGRALEKPAAADKRVLDLALPHSGVPAQMEVRRALYDVREHKPGVGRPRELGRNTDRPMRVFRSVDSADD